METRVLLYDSLFCRLCAGENSSGVLLYSSEENESDLSALVNKFLPVKISNDGKLPRTICPGCNIQLHATVQFLELVVEGQRKLRDLWKSQVEYQKRLEREQLKVDPSELEAISDAILAEGEGTQIFVQMPDGTLFPADHGLTLKMEGLEKPRRKRGRPPKKTPDPQEPGQQEVEKREPEPEQEAEEAEDYEDGDGRRRRRKKIPRRFMEAVQGKELERMFREEGVIDEDDDDGQKPVLDEKPEVEHDTPDEVIGHLETPEGRDLGELVVINKGRGRGRPRNSRKRKINYECEICGRGFQHHGRYLFHKTYHKGVKYGCGTCQKQFTSKELLELHHKTMEHSGEEIIEGKKGEDPETTADTLFCLTCSKDFDSKQTYELHLKTVHGGEKPFSCTVCTKSFAYQASLKYHMLSQHEAKRNHEPEKTDIKTDGNGGYVCDICGKVLNHPSSVVYHKEAEHNNGRRFVCNKCNKSFKHKQLLQRHQLVHSDDRPFVCAMCGHSFKTKANWLNHQSTHTGEKKYFCELCGQQFAHKTSLTLHYRWHAGHKPYECHVCQKKFSQNGNLQEHLRIHSGEKPFCCDYCGRKFTTSSQFKLHVKRHTGERPWKCEFCGKSFLHKDTWKCHTRRHKGERPFQCSHCNRGFTEQWALKKHIRLHTGEKPYSCTVCGKAFADCSNLTKHKKVHQDNKPSSANPAALADQEYLPLDRALYKIIETQLSQEDQLGNENAATATVPSVTAIADTPTVGDNDTSAVQQIIYVYQDPDDPTEPRTLHMMDEANRSTTENLKLLQPADDGPSLSDLPVTSSNTSDPLDLHHLMQVTDEDGNPIQLTMQDGHQLQITTADGQSLLVTTDDGRAIPVQFATTEGHPINPYLNGLSAADVQSPCETDGLIIEQNGAVTQAETDTEQAYEFTTQDGQKVRLVAAFDVSSTLQLPTDFIGPSISQVQ